MSPRAIIAAVIKRRGLEKQAVAVAAGLAPLPANARSMLSRYLGGSDMHGERVGAILAALGLTIVCATCRKDPRECTCR